ncbi:MAG TPA: type IV-A pilus assembly ATPase PilB [Arenicellales bacterium]|nr:type IV-A pilus assembly ATPase PilB [Arenicellales bacterium]HJP09864.1 type IV-A pilus assembly ATPase PilB [Arenicellales bacterium]
MASTQEPITAVEQWEQQKTIGGLARRMIEQDLINRSQAETILGEAEKNGHSFLAQTLQSDVANRERVYHCASEEFGMPFLDLGSFDLDTCPDGLVNNKFIETHKVLPLYQRGTKVFLATTDPSDSAGLDAFKFQTGLGVEAILVDSAILARSIEQSNTGVSTGLAELSDDGLDELEISAGDEEDLDDPTSTEVDTPVVRFVNKIFMDAIRQGASDIHIEPYEEKLRIRNRQDGVLQEIGSAPSVLGPRIVARIKILSNLNIAERRVPQDGRMRIKLSKNQEIDFRVSTLPTQFGEKVVIRILDGSGAALGLEVLGLESEQFQLYEEAIRRPYGMILVTGPTGSGKTVSLYSALNVLNTPDINISSVEDPVEISVPGINQVAINEKANLDFSMALRAFLRQDPDIIMVGEIRDLETADIAIKASQTGHLVLSTLHTNDAAATITRLLNMGVEPFNVASSVHLIMAQRLVRRLCTKCRQKTEHPPEALLSAGFDEADLEDLTIYGPVGCDECVAGYKGRTGIYQVLPITEAMIGLIIRGAEQDRIEQQASDEGVSTLRQSGLKKIKAGITSLEEILRVTNL